MDQIKVVFESLAQTVGQLRDADDYGIQVKLLTWIHLLARGAFS